MEKSIVKGLSFNLEEFQRNKDELTRVANAEAAEKIQAIRTLLKELKTLVEVSGITIYMGNLKDDLTAVEELHPDWNSSSYDC